jgi:hypothetical protein
VPRSNDENVLKIEHSLLTYGQNSPVNAGEIVDRMSALNFDLINIFKILIFNFF